MLLLGDWVDYCFTLECDKFCLHNPMDLINNSSPIYSCSFVPHPLGQSFLEQKFFKLFGS